MVQHIAMACSHRLRSGYAPLHFYTFILRIPQVDETPDLQSEQLSAELIQHLNHV